MKKVLIITYYWPPSGGAGVQRWLKFVKYFRKFGWEPVVYTVENPESPETDFSLELEIPEGIKVLKRPIWEPYSAYKKFLGQKKDEKIQAAFLSEKKRNPLAEKISVWIRGNLFIPDARKFFIHPSVKFLTKYLAENPVDIVISTGPPHSMHLIAMKISEAASLPWLADFRDPWTGIDYYKELRLTSGANARHHKLERQVLEMADAVTVVSPSMAEEFKSTCDRNYEVITNGFDENDFMPDSLITPDPKFSVAHIGTLTPSRNPMVLWKALQELVNEDEDFRRNLEIKLVGKVDHQVLSSIQDSGLTGYLNQIAYLPHKEVLKTQQSSQVLLLLINNTPNAKGILTGKLFEYLASGRPVLCIGPADGDAAAILKQTHSGLASGFEDHHSLKVNIHEYFKLFQKGELKVHSTDIEKFSRESLTSEMARIMDRIVQKKTGK